MFTVGVEDVSANGGIDTIYVNDSGGNDSWDGSTWATAKKTIDNAIIYVNANGTVNIADGIYSGVGNTNITIDKNMNIQGQSQEGTIINGTDTNWIFHINNGISVTLARLTLTNGMAEYSGAIYNHGDLTVTNCAFNENLAGSDSVGGGAIMNFGGLSLSDCTFTGNTATGSGGGAIWTNHNGVSVSDCTFTGNTATAGVGGAIMNFGYGVSVSDCTFTGNTATAGYGGAICNWGNGVSVSDCTFNLNTANKGGAFSCQGTSTVTGSTFTGNTATNGGAIENIMGNMDTLTVTGSTFTGNTATNGGAIENLGILTVTGSNFNSNTAFSAGAIFNSVDGTLTVTESNFIRNIASYEAGAILNAGTQSKSGTATIIGNNFISNTANLWAGAISNYGNLTVNFNRIINNTAPTATDIHGDADRGSIDALYNWWGSNSGPGINSLVNVDMFDPWLVLRFTANPTTILQGATSTLTADFRYDSADGFHDTSLGHLPDDTPVTFTTTLGNVGSKSTDKLTINGIATAILRADEAAGEAIVGVLADTQPLTSNVIITPVVNAASTTNAIVNGKTVGMQTTGTPIVPLALAVLTVLGGLAATRKKQ